MDSKILIAILGSLAITAIGLSTLGLFFQFQGPSDEQGTNDVPQADQPNMIFIMLDDLGYNDVSWNNYEVHTPHMEQLARSGVILNRNYVYLICTPSRGEFLTGKYAHRLGLQRSVVEPDRQLYIPLGEKLLGEHLQELGYSTHVLGKWHAGHCRLDYVPTRRGFDTFYGTLNGYLDSYTRCSQSRYLNDSAFDWYDQERVDKSRQGIHVTDLIKERALDIIDRSGSEPFFLFMSFPAPHVPVQVDEKYLVHYGSIEDEWRKEYLGMITHVDEAVGEVVAKLRERGLFDNTIIAMTADNGGDIGPSSNYPLRGAKASTFEGGQRVPGFISGPQSIITKHGYINNERIHMTDWLPTFVSMAKGEIDSKSVLDGVDQSNMLCHGRKSARREVVYHVDSESVFGYGALSYDNYKLVHKSAGLNDGWIQDNTLGFTVAENETFANPRVRRVSNFNSPLCSGTIGLPYNITMFLQASVFAQTLENRTLLFDIEADPEERVDLSTKMPEKVNELKERLERHMLNEIDPPESGIYPISITQRDKAWITGWC